jgi:hypothetical protein
MTFKVGDLVRLKSVPHTLIHDLPIEEQREMLSFVGQTTRIERIDDYGFIWLGFGRSEEGADGARYSGHSFSVTPECLEFVTT